MLYAISNLRNTATGIATAGITATGIAAAGVAALLPRNCLTGRNLRIASQAPCIPRVAGRISGSLSSAAYFGAACVIACTPFAISRLAGFTARME